MAWKARPVSAGKYWDGSRWRVDVIDSVFRERMRLRAKRLGCPLGEIDDVCQSVLVYFLEGRVKPTYSNSKDTEGRVLWRYLFGVLRNEVWRVRHGSLFRQHGGAKRGVRFVEADAPVGGGGKSDVSVGDFLPAELGRGAFERRRRLVRRLLDVALGWDVGVELLNGILRVYPQAMEEVGYNLAKVTGAIYRLLPGYSYEQVESARRVLSDVLMGDLGRGGRLYLGVA